MALTAPQLLLLRTRMGGISTSVLSDSEFNLFWDATASARTEAVHLNATLAMGWESLMADAVKLHNYAAGQSRHDLDQVFKHVETMYRLYKADLDKATGTRTRQIAIAGVRAVPRAEREYPAEHDDHEQDR